MPSRFHSNYPSRPFKDTASLNHRHCTPTTLLLCWHLLPAFELGAGAPGLCISHIYIPPFLQFGLNTSLSSPGSWSSGPCPVGYFLALPVRIPFPCTVTRAIILSELLFLVYTHSRGNMTSSTARRHILYHLGKGLHPQWLTLSCNFLGSDLEGRSPDLTGSRMPCSYFFQTYLWFCCISAQQLGGQ